MRDRLMVGQRTLNPFIMVRVHAGQQRILALRIYTEQGRLEPFFVILHLW